MKNYTKEELNEIFSDKEFVTKMANAATGAELQAVMMEKGIDATDDETATIHRMLDKIKAGEITTEQLESGELPEELMEQVTGGILGVFYFCLGFAIGFLTGGTLGIIGLGIYEAVTKDDEPPTSVGATASW